MDVYRMKTKKGAKGGKSGDGNPMQRFSGAFISQRRMNV